MCFQDVVFLSFGAIWTSHFSNVVVEVKAFGPPHVLECGWG